MTIKIHTGLDTYTRLVIVTPPPFNALIHLVRISVLSNYLVSDLPHKIVNLRTGNPPYLSWLSSLPRNALVIIVIHSTWSE